MHSPIRGRWVLTALAGAALLFGTAAQAVADEESESEATEVTETRKMRVFVTTKDGEQTVRVMRLKDGKWVVVDEGQGGDGNEGAAIRLRRVDTTPGTSVRVKELEIEAEEGTHSGKSPLPTLLRWLFEAAHKEADALEAWFAAGEDVPLAILRDMMQADGWDAASLRAWLHDQVRIHLEAWLRDHVRPRGHDRGHTGCRCTCPGCGEARCARCGECGCGRGAAGGSTGWPEAGTWWSGPKLRTAQRAYVLWNDGSGWHHRELPGGAGWGPGPRMPPPPPAPPAPPRAPWPRRSGPMEDLEDLPPELRTILRGLLEGAKDAGAAPPASERPGPEASAAREWAALAGDAMPHLLRMFEDLPPESRRALIQQLARLAAQLMESGAEDEPFAEGGGHAR